MKRTMLKSKIHRARVTGADLHYVGSITIDRDLLEAADILAQEELERYQPRVVHVNGRNSIVQVDDRVAEVAA